jgi:dTDP-N-acetylfucosamine:lipid II N-acetylfucosaminyltransferase
MLHVLNCITDDKFIDDLIEVLDASGDNVFHDFIYISDTKINKFTYIKSYKRIKVICIRDFLPLIQEQKYDAIVLHNFFSLPISNIINIPQNILLLWFAWGYDIYKMPVYRPLAQIANIYAPLTKKYVIGGVYDRLRHYHSIIDSYLKRKILQRAVKRIDYFSGVLPNEYKLLKSNNFFRAHEVEFSYFNLKSDIRENNLNSPVAKSKNILIGNSGDPTNNHLDIFEFLYRQHFRDNKIYCFLSYGGTTEYKNKVKEVGFSYFGNNFIPIEQFLPYKQFSDIIMSCGNVVMGHERQQAIGNIIQSIWNGCKLFLSETSITYNFLNERGYRLFTIQNDLNKSIINKEISIQDIIGNRQLLIKYNSTEVQMMKIQKIYNIINNHKLEINSKGQL